ncbi:MAG: adenylate/guanylate cyclase domain-containing protein, partial [Rubrivivax sp.]|nr:adenylate/guanylate cyclase domain-containing protein [Rubrivivax sp.]
MALHHYLPQDRLRALAERRSLLAHARGSALFADISGFTALTEALTHAHGERRGVELLSRAVSEVYDALIAEVERCGGSTLSFAGDATLCWFDAADAAGAGLPGAEGEADVAMAAAAARAVQAALAMQAAMQAVAKSVALAVSQAALQVPGAVVDAAPLPMALKVSVASGTARRFVVGDAAIQTLDVLAGPAVSRVAMADTLAMPGDVLLDEATAHAVQAPVLAWRCNEEGARFAVLAAGWHGPALPQVPAAAAAAGWPQLASLPSADQLRPWVLPFVYEREMAGEGLFVTDLRPVVALFLRFGGLEDAQGELDDRAVHRLDGWICAAQGILQQHGGVLLELIVGDKGSYLYAAFGAALAHEDDACRALHAALALRALFGAESGDAAGACIGVASGTLRVGGYGSRNRQSFGAQGDAVNAAARLMMLARPGEILGSGRVRAAVAPAFALQPRPPIA